jgi:hypothetical protein
VEYRARTGKSELLRDPTYKGIRKDLLCDARKRAHSCLRTGLATCLTTSLSALTAAPRRDLLDRSNVLRNLLLERV